MKPRNSVYRILARCKAATHGKSFKAKRTQENAKFNQEIREKHLTLAEEIAKTWELLEEDY